MSGIDNGWLEAAIAWEVCASLHRQYCKGKDDLFTTRQSDFVKHAENAREHISHGQAPAVAEAILFEHEDGRYAVNPDTTGDPAWHRLGPVDVSAIRSQQPAQAQAGAVPLTDIRKAALDLYKPPFRHEHGYIRDANHQMVADDAWSEGSGLIASRIRGWKRIQYLDKPEQRAAALQDEVAEMVAEALNTYWAAHGIKGGQHGAE